MKNIFEYENADKEENEEDEEGKNDKDEDDINIPAIGLINYSRENQRYKNNFKQNDLNLSYLYNVCYINASIQCLFRLKEFVKKILKCDKEDNLIKATQNLIKNMKKKNKSCSVYEIKYALAQNNKIYENNEEEDANEFITNYLNYLIDETKDTSEIKIKWRYSPSDEIIFKKFNEKFLKRKGNSFILDLFYGLLRTENYCKNCKHIISINFNPFNILEISLNEDYLNNNPLKMQDLLKEFIEEKNDLNEICPLCKNHINYKTSINSLPPCLIINFIRDYSNNKLNNIIIPKSFNFLNYINEKLLQDGDEANYFYNLKGIIFYQYSEKNLSHYSSACLLDDMNWYYFDDQNYEIDKALRIYNYENPIFLFYEK